MHYINHYKDAIQILQMISFSYKKKLLRAVWGYVAQNQYIEYVLSVNTKFFYIFLHYHP